MSLSHLEFTEPLNVYINIFHQIWIVFSQYVLEYFVCSFLRHLSFWYSHYIYGGALNGILHFSEALFIFLLPLLLLPLSVLLILFVVFHIAKSLLIYLYSWT